MTTGEIIILIVWTLLMLPMIVKAWVEAYRECLKSLREWWKSKQYSE